MAGGRSDAANGADRPLPEGPVRIKPSLFVRPRSDGVPDILDAIQELGGIRSPVGYKFADKGEYDGFKEAFRGEARLLIRRTAGMRPDELLEALVNPESGIGQIFRLESISDLYDKVNAAVLEREAVRHRASKERRSGAILERFTSGKRSGCVNGVKTGDLRSGDRFNVMRYPCEVRQIDPDTLAVRIECGEGGSHELPQGITVYPDRCIVHKTAPEDLQGIDDPWKENPMKRRRKSTKRAMRTATVKRSMNASEKVCKCSTRTMKANPDRGNKVKSYDAFGGVNTFESVAEAQADARTRNVSVVIDDPNRGRMSYWVSGEAEGSPEWHYAKANPIKARDATPGRELIFRGHDGVFYRATVLQRPRRGLVKIRYGVPGVGTVEPAVEIARLTRPNPVRVRKLPGRPRYQVKSGRRITAFATTRRKAAAQARILATAARLKHGKRRRPRRNPVANVFMIRDAKGNLQCAIGEVITAGGPLKLFVHQSPAGGSTWSVSEYSSGATVVKGLPSSNAARVAVVKKIDAAGVTSVVRAAKAIVNRYGPANE